MSDAALSLHQQLGGWVLGNNYSVTDFTPLTPAVAQWDGTAEELRRAVDEACKTTGQFFAAGRPQAPTTTTPPRPVAGWSTPGVRVVCAEANASFAGTTLSRDEVIGLAGLSFKLPNRRIVLAAPGSPCDATITINFTGTALLGEYNSTPSTLYTGATMTGTLALSAPGQPDLVVPISHRE